MNLTLKRLQLLSLLATALLLTVSCTTVKEYQKSRLNDADMVMHAKKIQKTESSFQSYREGASGLTGGKSGGGCGCN